MSALIYGIALAESANFPLREFWKMMMTTEPESSSDLDEQRICDILAALRMDDKVDLDSILQNPLVVNTLVSGQMAILHLACHLRSPRLVKALLERGESVNCKTGDGTYPIHIVCSKPKNVTLSLRILDFFFQYGVDVNVQDAKGRTALYLAASHNLVPVVETLIRAGCRVNVPDRKYKTPLALSCQLASEGWYFWNTDCLNDENGTLNPHCFPPSLISQSLLRAGAIPKHATLLPSAILHANMDVVKEFLCLGMDVNAMDKYRRTPLECACSTPPIPTSMLKLLLDAGADVNENRKGRKNKPIILAFVHNSVDKIKLLLSYGATINTEEMSELVSISLSKLFLENPEVIDEDSKELLSWKLLIKAGFKPQLDIYMSKLKRVYLCSSYSKVSKTIENLLFPLNSLSDICRISIRSQISLPVDESIDHLPVPNSLKNFLKFHEFCS